MLKTLWLYVRELLIDVLTLRVSNWGWHLSNLYNFLVKGYTHYEIMDMDDAFFTWFIPRIAYFRKVHRGVPTVTTEYKWNKALDNMYKYAVESQNLLRVGYYKDDNGEYHAWWESQSYKKFQYLFSKYMQHLWF